MDVYIGVGVRRDKLCSAYPPTSGDQMLPAVRPVGVHLDRCLWHAPLKLLDDE